MKLYLSLAFFLGAASAVDTLLKDKLAARKLLTTEGPVICHLYQLDGFEDIDEGIDEELIGNYTDVESFVCQTSASEEGDVIGRVYDIDLPPDFIEDKKELIQGGRAMLTVTNAVKTRSYDASPDVITLTEASVLSVQTERRGLRRLAGERTSGDKTFFLVRLTTQDTEHPNTLPISATDISNVVWGVDDRDLTFRNQYAQCSADKLQFKPAEGLGIIDGVMEITLDIVADKARPGSLTNIVYEAAADILGGDPEELFDYTGICFPDAIDFGGASGLGALGGSRTWYGKKACANLGVLMHEIGHNFAFSHSNSATGGGYGDSTCTMGSAGSKSCFNGSKMWFLGWHADRNLDLGVSQLPFNGKLVPLTQYGLASGDELVVVKIGDYYIQYNKFESFNTGVGMNRNTATITLSTTSGKPNGPTNAVGAVDQHWPEFRVQDFEGSGFDLVIEHCESVSGIEDTTADGLTISMYLDDGTQTSQCPGGKPQPVYSAENMVACTKAGTKNYLLAPDECENLCGVTEGCLSYSYDYTRTDRRCSLCDKAFPDKEIACAEGELCSTWGRIDETKDYVAPSPPLSLTGYQACNGVGRVEYLISAFECESLCGINDECLSWSYHLERTDRRCNLCNTDFPQTPVTCADESKCTVWGSLDESKTYEAPPEHTSLIGYEACSTKGNYFYLDSVSDCETVCGLTDGCLTFSFHPQASKPMCLLCDKSHWAKKIEDSSVIWGKVTDQTYSPLPEFNNAVNYGACYNMGVVDYLQHPDQCHQACLDTVGCKTWDYNPLNGDRKRCRLCNKNSPNEIVPCTEGEICRYWGSVIDYGASPATPSPTEAPTTSSPTASPVAITSEPSTSPTQSPTTASPSEAPSVVASASPSSSPTQAPTTASPSAAPSIATSSSPSEAPSVVASASPTLSPSDAVTEVCTWTVPDGYRYFPHVSSSRRDIERKAGYTVSMLADHCDSLPECLGFNTNGWLKWGIKDESDWVVKFESECEGFLVKESYYAES